MISRRLKSNAIINILNLYCQVVYLLVPILYVLINFFILVVLFYKISREKLEPVLFCVMF
jgi:hypothetical protein